MTWDFDGDEWVFFIAAAAVALVGVVRYYRPLISVSSIRMPILRRGLLASIPALSIVPTYIVLQRWADAQVVGHLDYTILFMVGAGAWILTASWFMPVLGISVRDDTIERDNPAALVAVSGILLAVGCVYALSNIGSGPTIWTTVIPALAASILLATMSILIELVGEQVAEAITIDRDVATAMRLAGGVIGCAIILGGAAAGNWVSWNRTWIDFAHRGWPAILIAVAAGVVHRKLRPTAIRPKPDIFVFGLAPAAIFLAVGISIAAIASRHL
jgi:hypothetical protein